MKLDRKQDLNVLYQVCVFRDNQKKQDGRPGLWLAETFSTFSLKQLNGIQGNLTGSKISKSSTKFVFFGLIPKIRWTSFASYWLRHFDFVSETTKGNLIKLDRKKDLNVLYQVCVFRDDQKKQDGRPGLWLAETFSTSHLKPLNGIQGNLTGSKISTSSTKFVFFEPMGKKWPPWRLIGWDIFDFSTETTERNATKLDRKQNTNVLYQVCVFRADWKKTRWPPWPLMCWDIFDFSSETSEWNSRKADRK